MTRINVPIDIDHTTQIQKILLPEVMKCIDLHHMGSWSFYVILKNEKMKKVLIISEQDMAGIRLTELYNSLFAHEVKILLYCTINIIDCQQNLSPFDLRKARTSAVQSNPSALPKHMSHTKPHKMMHAKTCRDLTDIIRAQKIGVVLVPNFIYDRQRAAQYDQIVKEIKKTCEVEIIGLYV